MSQPTLELSEHELYFLPPSTPAIGPVTRVEIEGELFLARLVLLREDAQGRRFYSIFYESEAIEDPGIFSNGVCLSSKYVDFPTLTDADVISKKAAKYKNFSERLWCSPDGDYGIRFNIHGSTICWGERRDRVEDQVLHCSQFPDQKKLFDLPQSDFLKLCAEFHQKGDPEFNFILRWRKLTITQRDEIAFNCERGSWDELLYLFSLVQLVIVHRFEALVDNPANCCWRIDHVSRQSGCVAVASWIERWHGLLCEIFRPSFWSEEYNCVRKWRRAAINEQRCEVHYSSPTAHELLEAQLELREFLRPHLPCDEIEALFAP